MLVSSPQARPAVRAEAEEEEESSLRVGLASRVLSGPGLWLDWLEDLDRRGLIEDLLAEGVIEEAVATAPHGHQLDRALNAKTTLLCVLAGCLFPGEGKGPGPAGRAGGAAGVRAGRRPHRRGAGHRGDMARDGDHRLRRHDGG